MEKVLRKWPEFQHPKKIQRKSVDAWRDAGLNYA